MLLSMHTLPWLLLVIVIAVIWWHALGAKKAARRAARRACHNADVRFIDELALQKLSLERPLRSNGRRAWCLRRHYRFQFYWGGETRHDGHVIMQGQRVVSVQLDPYPL